MVSYSKQMVISQNSGFYRPLVGSDNDLSNSRDRPKTDFTFSAENKNRPKMKFHFRPETETKTKTATYFWPKTKTKLSSSRNNMRQSNVLL